MEQLTDKQYRNLIVSLLDSVETNAKNGHADAFNSNFAYLERMLREYRDLLSNQARHGKN
jgi:hypothetical protein